MVEDEERRKQRVLIDMQIAEALKGHLANEDKRLSGWHLGREVPIAVLVFLAGQTAGMIWWAATAQASITENRKEMSSMRGDRAADKVVQLATDKRQDEDSRRSEDRIMAELRDIKQLIRR